MMSAYLSSLSIDQLIDRVVRTTQQHENKEEKRRSKEAIGAQRLTFSPTVQLILVKIDG